MTRHSRNILSASTAAFGVLSLIYLEAVATVQAVDALTASALITGFAAAGVMRWYLFYEGQTLREIDSNAARIAFRWSVALSVFVMVYAVTLFATREIDWRTLTVFLLVVSTLSVVEWVFGRRAGANVHPDVLRLKAQRLTNVKAALRYRSQVMAQRKAIEALTKDLRSLKSEHDATTLRMQAINETLTLAESKTGNVKRIGKVTFATTCPDCFELVTWNQAKQNPACECGHEFKMI